MIRNFLLITVLFSAFWLKSQEASLTIRITDIRTEEGKILVALFDSDETFMEADARFREVVFQPEKGFIENTISLPPGNYALAVLHDLDGNERMTTTIVGVPEEGYGYSNNPGKRLTDPPFETCEFSIAGAPATVEVDLVYW